MKTGDKIRKAREAWGLTQHALAVEAGMGQGQLSKTLRVRMILDEEGKEDAAVLHQAGGHAGELMRKKLLTEDVNLTAKLDALRIERIVRGIAEKHGGFDERVNLGFGEFQGRHVLS